MLAWAAIWGVTGGVSEWLPFNKRFRYTWSYIHVVWSIHIVHALHADFGMGSHWKCHGWSFGVAARQQTTQVYMVIHPCSMEYSHCARFTRRFWHGQPLGVSWGGFRVASRRPTKHMHTISSIHVVWNIHIVHNLHVDVCMGSHWWVSWAWNPSAFQANKQSKGIHGHTSM